MRSIEDFRGKVLRDLFATKTMESAWPIWSPRLNELTDGFANAEKVFNLGDSLSSVFALTAEAGRGQGVLSSAGHAWEGLVTLYLNMIFSGTNAIAMKQKKNLVPRCFLDATSINYFNDPTNTESDVVVITFPQGFLFDAAGESVESLSHKISPRLAQFELGIIQCKTNWNDNSQIPMLWDLVYRAQGFDAHHITVGQNGHRFSHLRKFTYSFVTVPSQKGTIKATDMAVKRVRNLSGGNYWGKATNGGIAFSLKEIFQRNFSSAFSGNPIRESVAQAINGRQGAFSTLRA